MEGRSTRKTEAGNQHAAIGDVRHRGIICRNPYTAEAQMGRNIDWGLFRGASKPNGEEGKEKEKRKQSRSPKKQREASPERDGKLAACTAPSRSPAINNIMIFLTPLMPMILLVIRDPISTPTRDAAIISGPVPARPEPNHSHTPHRHTIPTPHGCSP